VVEVRCIAPTLRVLKSPNACDWMHSSYIDIVHPVIFACMYICIRYNVV
jgi:hypothetical protein